MASPALEEDAPSAPAAPAALDTALPLPPAAPPRRRLPMALARAALDSSFAAAASSLAVGKAATGTGASVLVPAVTLSRASAKGRRRAELAGIILYFE